MRQVGGQKLPPKLFAIPSVSRIPEIGILDTLFSEKKKEEKIRYVSLPGFYGGSGALRP
jgi:hypothetical protein